MILRVFGVFLIVVALLVGSCIFRPWQRITIKASPPWRGDVQQITDIRYHDQVVGGVRFSASLVPYASSAYSTVGPYELNVICYAETNAVAFVEVEHVILEDSKWSIQFDEQLVGQFELNRPTINSAAGRYDVSIISFGQKIAKERLTEDLSVTVTVVVHTATGELLRGTAKVHLILKAEKGIIQIPEI